MSKQSRKRNKVNGWDERDYKLWSEIMDLPHYGLIADDAANPMLSRKQVIAVVKNLLETDSIKGGMTG